MSAANNKPTMTVSSKSTRSPLWVDRDGDEANSAGSLACSVVTDGTTCLRLSPESGTVLGVVVVVVCDVTVLDAGAVVTALLLAGVVTAVVFVGRLKGLLLYDQYMTLPRGTAPGNWVGHRGGCCVTLGPLALAPGNAGGTNLGPGNGMGYMCGLKRCM